MICASVMLTVVKDGTMMTALELSTSISTWCAQAEKWSVCRSSKVNQLHCVAHSYLFADHKFETRDTPWVSAFFPRFFVLTCVK